MSQNPPTVSLMIMGKEYKITCDPEEQEELIYSAQKLDQQMRKMRDSGKVAGPDRIAVMAALNLAHELQMLKSEHTRLLDRFDESLIKLSKKIENVLENP